MAKSGRHVGIDGPARKFSWTEMYENAAKKDKWRPESKKFTTQFPFRSSDETKLKLIKLAEKHQTSLNSEIEALIIEAFRKEFVEGALDGSH